jgi:hypothetical protein
VDSRGCSGATPSGSSSTRARWNSRGLDTEARSRSKDLVERQRKEREVMRTLLDAESPDESAILSQADLLGQIDTDLRKQDLRTMLAMRRLLTPEQRAELKKPDALELLETRAWPGKVRELQSGVGQAVIEATLSGSPEIGAEHGLVPVDALPGEPEVGPVPTRAERRTLASAARVFQRERIARTRADENQNVSRVALVLGIARSPLYTLMRDLGIERREREAMPQTPR